MKSDIPSDTECVRCRGTLKAESPSAQAEADPGAGGGELVPALCAPAHHSPSPSHISGGHSFSILVRVIMEASVEILVTVDCF